jgi:hypothetical protein
MAGQSVIGALRVNLGLDSAQFTKGLTKSQQQMAQFARRVKQAAAVAAVAFAAAVTRMTTSGLEFIDNQVKMARSIDGTVDGLRALQLAGGDAGVGADAVGQAMQKLGRRLDEAQVRGGPVADALDRIGLSAADLMKMDADERLAAIADRAKELGFTAQQTAGLLGEFGIRNAEMSLLVMQGGDAIRAARAEIVDLGLSLNAVDTLKVEEANDAFSRIRFGVEALSNRLAVAFAPALEAMSVAFVSLMREGGGLRIVIDALGENIGRIAAYAAGFAAVMAGKFAFAVGVVAVKAVMGLRLSLVGLKAALISSGIGIAVVAAGFLIEKFTSLVKSSGGFGNALVLLKDVAVEVFERIRLSFGVVPAAIAVGSANMREFFMRGLLEMAIGFRDFTKMIADGLNSLFGSNLQGAGQGIVDSLGIGWGTALADGAVAGTKLSGILSEVGGKLESVQALRDHMTQTAEETDGAATSAANLAAELADLGSGGSSGGGGAGSVGEVTTAVETLGSRMEAVKSTMQSAFTGLVTGAKSLKDTLGDMLSTFADMLANQAFQSLFAGGFGGLFPIPANANGTNNFQGGLTSVNERGGEIMNLPRGTQIIPNDISKRMADRGGVQNVHVTVGVSADSNGNLLPFVASVTQAGIQQNNKRIATAQGRPT